MPLRESRVRGKLVTYITANFAACWHSLLIRLALQGKCTPAGLLRMEEFPDHYRETRKLRRSLKGRPQPAVSVLTNAASSPPVLMQAEASSTN